MRIGNGLVASAVIALGLAAPVHAQEVPCDMVTAGIGAVVGGALGAPLGPNAQLFAAAAGAAGSQAAFAEKCNKSLEDLIDHYIEHPIDYDEFVRIYCNSNPLNCPNDLNPYSPWTSQPWGCGSLLVQCAMFVIRGPGGQGPFTSVSVNDILDAMTFVGISLGYGHWASDYGYLVGVDGGVLTP